MKTHIVTIEKMAFGGSGVGRVEGKVCFVPFTAPGDSVRVRIVSEKRSYLTAEVVDLLTASAERVIPPCPVFGRCGGCNWQHLSRRAQSDAKQEIFSELLWRSARVDRSRIERIVEAPEPYGYRARMQFKIRFAAGQLHMGFYRSGSHSVIDVPQTCAIASPAVNRIFPVLRAVMIGFPEPGTIHQIDVTVGDDEAAAVVFHYTGSRLRETSEYLTKLTELGGMALFLRNERKNFFSRIAGGETLSYQVPQDFLPAQQAVDLFFTPGGFSQVNYRQNLALISTVFAWAGLTGRERILDLFCGNGNFSIPLARSAAGIVGFEDYSQSVMDAERNCIQNHIDNASYRSVDALAGLQELVSAGEQFDLVILDPPRAGAADLVKHIPVLQPAKIVYISCDPATLARDIGILGEVGYAVTRTQPVDMFPQTYHLESITLFERMS
jgi:23S rRNA (uracil1939-C5)-methyltransferase